MPRRRFRWTRERYRKAAHLSRYFARHIYDLPSEQPELLRLFGELWARHPQRDDPLTVPMLCREPYVSREDDVPF